MAVPHYMASSHRFLELQNVTDVDTILSALTDELVNNANPAWTEPSSHTFVSPVDAVGRWFKVEFSRISAGEIKMRAWDKTGQINGLCYDKRMDIDTGGTNVHLATGEFHLTMTSLRTAGAEELACGMLDLFPYAQSAHPRYVYARGTRTVTDGPEYNIFEQWGMNDLNWYGGAGGSATLYRVPYPCVNQGYGTYVRMIDALGNYYPLPVDMFTPCPAIGDMRRAGRLFQHFMCDGSLQPGTFINFPLDDETIGKFVVTGIPNAVNSGYGTSARICVRAE